MYPFNIGKVKAINQLRRPLVLYHKLQCSLAALTCTLSCCTPLWLPAVSTLLKVFPFVSLPKIGSVLLSPKVVFIIGNLIGVVLVAETNLSSKTSSIDVCYYEHVKRSQQRTEGPSKLEVSEGERLSTPAATLRDQMIVEEDERAREAAKEEENQCGSDDDSEDDEDGDATSTCLSEDLSRRPDEFIERVNSRRRLEVILVNHAVIAMESLLRHIEEIEGDDIR